MAELKKMLEAKGHNWKDFAVAGGGGENAMTVLKSRVVSGKPPTAAQVKGPGIQEWGAEGVLANLDDVAKAGNWDGLLPGVVSNVMKYQGNYVAVPVNVHRVNWMWANPEVFKKAGAKIPTTWDEFVVAADKIQKAGFIAVAHGGQPWQDATLFESIALGVGGADWYKKAFVDLDPKALNSAADGEGVRDLAQVQKYIDKDAANRDWNLATAMVINGKAAMQFMGDWAKGEFTAAGKVPGKDYVCMAAPGTKGAFTFNIDSFIMFQQKDASAQKAQAPSGRGDHGSQVPGGVQPEQGLDPGAHGHGPGQVRPVRQGLGGGVQLGGQERNAGAELGPRDGDAACQQGRDVRRGHRFMNTPRMTPKQAAERMAVAGKRS